MHQPLTRLLAPGLAFGVALAGCRSGSPPTAGSPVRPAGSTTTVSAADVHFMSGMILHHAQAVLMAAWAMDSVHSAGPSLRTLAGRVDVSQRDEIAFMQRWLRERRQTVPEADYTSSHAMHLDPHMLMPGMLQATQLAQLDATRGRAFDRLFLTFMIQHHQGAITMVERLLGTPGAAQDGIVFRFAADVHADQSAEIDRMSRMLAALP